MFLLLKLFKVAATIAVAGGRSKHAFQGRDHR